MAVYVFVYVYQAYRLMFAEIFFLSEKKAMSTALHDSWELTAGHVIEFLAGAVAGSLVLGIGVGIATEVLRWFALLPFELSSGTGWLVAGIVVMGLVQAAGAAFMTTGFWSVIMEMFVQANQKRNR